MKKLSILSAILLSGALFTNSASAQIRVNVGFNLGGPVVVQRPVAVPAYNDYYYLPEVDAYYSVGENLYYYNDGYDWVSAGYLPGAYRNYSWRNVRRVEIHANRPYMNHNVYRTRYRGNEFDWRRYNGQPNRNFGRNDRNDHRDWSNNRDNRPDWNGRDRRPDDRNDNRGNNGWGNQGPAQQPGRGDNRPSQPGRGDSRPAQPGRGDNRPSQNDNRGGDRGGRPNFADNNGNGFGRGNRS